MTAPDFDGKVVLVTGGSSGIGRATALAFARAGARVAIASRGAEPGEAVAGELRHLGAEAMFRSTDVSVATDVEALLDEVVGRYGQLDCAFNNAGIGGVRHLTHEIEEEQWDRMLAINLKGVWLSMKYELREMSRRGGGAIVNMSSLAGLVGTELGGAAYTASKHGVVGLTRTAALEYAKAGIRINAVCPGSIGTEGFSFSPEMQALRVANTPIGRLGTPGEVAEAVLWLCSDAASFVTGHALAVDGGYVAR